MIDTDLLLQTSCILQWGHRYRFPPSYLLYLPMGTLVEISSYLPLVSSYVDIGKDFLLPFVFCNGTSVQIFSYLLYIPMEHRYKFPYLPLVSSIVDIGRDFLFLISCIFQRGRPRFPLTSLLYLPMGSSVKVSSYLPLISSNGDIGRDFFFLLPFCIFHETMVEISSCLPCISMTGNGAYSPQSTPRFK